MMAKYKKKPVVIEAIRFTGSNYEEIREFIGKNTLCSDLSIVIPTLEGDMIAQKGDYIIKGVKGEFYPRKQKIYTKTNKVISEG